MWVFLWEMVLITLDGCGEPCLSKVGQVSWASACILALRFWWWRAHEQLLLAPAALTSAPWWAVSRTVSKNKPFLPQDACEAKSKHYQGSSLLHCELEALQRLEARTGCPHLYWEAQVRLEASLPYTERLTLSETKEIDLDIRAALVSYSLTTSLFASWESGFTKMNDLPRIK